MNDREKELLVKFQAVCDNFTASIRQATVLLEHACDLATALTMVDTLDSYQLPVTMLNRGVIRADAFSSSDWWEWPK